MDKFKLPQTTEWMQGQMEHEPTRSYAQEIYEIVREFPYSKALEIGSAWGVSGMAILTAGKGYLTSVDPNVNELTNEVRANGLEQRLTPYLMRSEKFWLENKGTYDLIYIDGSHLYKDFKNDIYEAWKVLNPDGLLICDDITHPANMKGDPTRDNEAEYGIAFGAWEFIKEHQITKIHTTTRLLYIYKNEQ